MKNILKKVLVIAFILLCKLQIKAQEAFDTVYLCMRYRNINRGGAGLTGTNTDFERIFFLHNEKKRIFLGQPDNYFENFNFRYIRLLFPKGTTVNAGLQFVRRPVAKKNYKTKLFDTSFTINPSSKLLAFTHIISSVRNNFEFQFLNDSSKGYRRIQKKLTDKRVIAQYNFQTKESVYYLKSARLFLESE